MGQQLVESVQKIKEMVPQIKVILADSAETPMFPKNQANKPAGVESIIDAPRKMSVASRALLYHKAGILTGCGGSRACGVAFTLAEKIGIDATVAFTITNFDQRILNNFSNFKRLEVSLTLYLNLILYRIRNSCFLFISNIVPRGQYRWLYACYEGCVNGGIRLVVNR